MTEEEIEELISELLEVESKVCCLCLVFLLLIGQLCHFFPHHLGIVVLNFRLRRQQESLEDESLEKVQDEVRRELAQSLHGEDVSLLSFSHRKRFADCFPCARY